MTTIALFGTPEDSAYLPRFREIVGPHAIKVSTRPEEYISSVAAKVKQHNIEAIITTDSVTMLTLLSTQPDFRRPLTKIGREKALTLDDYAGSCFTIPGSKLGVTHDVKILILNPLSHLVKTPEGTFVFKRFVSKITRPEAWFPQTRFSWEVWKPATSAGLLQKFSHAILLAIDIETYVGDEERRIHCVGYAGLFADGTTHTVVVPYKDMLAHGFVRALNASKPPKIFQNGMYDNLYFLRFNVPCTNWLYDTQHLFHSWYSELPKRLDFITAFSVRDIRFWKDDAKTGGEWELFEYNARDCWATLTAWCSLVTEVPKWALDNYRMEFPLVFPCLHMEADGLSLDREKFDAGKHDAERALEIQANKLSAWFGEKFNPASPDQCKRLLKVLGMGEVESADSKAMVACAAIHPFNELIVSAILAYRKQAKLLSTYFKWEKFWNGRLYYKTNPAGTDTGRLASTESSFWTGLQIQNIPQGKAVKSWIQADTGWDGLAEGDYAQSEARCVGYMSGCKALIDLVESDKDYHSWNAHKFFGVPYEEVSKDLRNLSKRVNHGSNYNMGAAVLLETMGPKSVASARVLLKLPAKWTLIQVCQHLLNVYISTYPEVKRDWYDDIKRTIKMNKKLVSPLGWTRHFFADPSSNKPALNAAVAHGPQNLSVTIINSVFYKIWHDTVYGDLRDRARLKAQIHDSIFFEYRGAEVPEIVRSRMQAAVPVTGVDGVKRTMVIPPDMSTGKSGTAKYWADLK
jgi:DNA polymerase I-like protein with 3'-5' exonuclease and polymerase domains